VSERPFDELVDVEGLDAEEAARLRRVHDLLVQAGPPPDLPPALERPPTAERAGAGADIVQFPLLPRRRLAAAVLLAAALAAAAFGAGFLVGDRGGGSTFEVVRVIPMRGQNGALASIQMGKRDSAGNWQMRFNVSGLPKQAEGGYYNLYLVKDGKPVVLCGSFRVHDKTTTLTFTVPYKAKRFEGWVVTQQPPGHHTPGRVVLST
jgi:hypothetical protein